MSEASGNGESTESIEFKKAVKDRDTRAIIKLAGGGANGVNISAAIMHFLVYITKGDVSSIYSDKLICNDYIPTFSSDNDLFMLAKDLNAGRAYINNIVNLQITFKEQQGNNLVFRVKFNLGGSVSDDSPIKTDQDYEFDFYMLMENGNWKIAGIRKG
ncbi:MAG: hypothetical protein LWY06_03890 [Firmicutes bacterium]|nr:hypothetical protein [Bacillota bacterium]